MQSQNELDKRAIARDVHSTLSQIPGATFYNAAEMAVDAVIAHYAAASQSANVAQGAEAAEPCKCQRLWDWQGFHHPLCDKAQPERALTVPSHIINAIIDYGNARADSRDAEANKDLSYAITAIRAALTAAQSASGDTQ